MRIKLTIVTVFFISTLFAQNKIEVGLSLGLNVGVVYGPNEDGGTGSPAIGPSTGISLNSVINDRWSMKSKVLYSFTGLNFQQFVDRVDYPTEIEPSPGLFVEVPLSYTADVDGKINLHYIEIPISFLYSFNEKIGLQFGPRVAFLAKGVLKGNANATVGTTANGEGLPVPPESFDEGNQLKFFDAGLTIGGNYKFSEKMSLNVDISTGLTAVNFQGEILPDKYKNLFLTTSFNYNLFSL